MKTWWKAVVLFVALVLVNGVGAAIHAPQLAALPLSFALGLLLGWALVTAAQAR